MNDRAVNSSNQLSTVGSGTKMARYKRKASKSIAEFFGVEEEVSEKNEQRWQKRRLRIAESIGSGIKDVDSQLSDELDGIRRIRDPLSRGISAMSRQTSRISTMTASDYGRKKSVLQMTLSGIRSTARRDTRKKSFKGQSFPRGSLIGEERMQADAFSLVDDVFFDEHPAPAPAAKQILPELEGEGSAPGWRRAPPQALPSTPGEDFPDGYDFGLRRIKDTVVASAARRDKRLVGQGILSRLMRHSINRAFLTKDVRKQMDDLDDHRPYFTYWVTFVQVVVFIVSVSVYGIAPFGISTTKVEKTVRMSNLAIQREVHIERDNLWIGPRQADLIHLGAKYSPCMRVDENLNEAIGYDIAAERESACCIRNDGSGCVQTVKSGCSGILSKWDKWEGGDTSPDGRISGSVCGQDPDYCKNPISSDPFKWPDDITKWPLCKEKAPLLDNVVENNNIDCELLGQPCCFGIQGECIITTQEHCELKRGYFHKEAYLCSQVNCFEEICGMIPFADPQKPDQFYRLWTSLFLHGGLVHLVITCIFQMWIMRDLEKLMGAIRVSIIYIGAGVAGNLASCTFIPYQVEAGPSGAQFGIAACLLVEVIQSYQIYRRPWIAIFKLVVPLMILFIFGLLPWFDNWAHLFGFLFGFLLAFALMPYVSFGSFDRHRKIISIIACLGLSIGLFTILVIVFYVAPLTECDWCIYFNCIPFTNDFCENMAVKLKTNTSYSKISSM